MTGRPVRALAPVTVSAVTDGGATETAIVTSDTVSTDTANDTVTVFGFLAITTGTDGTAVVVKVRRGPTANGHQIGETITATTTATDDYTVPFCFEDQPGLVAGLQYTVTVTETDASADGTVNVATIAGIVG